MATTIAYTQCPLCGSERLQHVFTVKDYTVSKQEFMIDECIDCTARFTQEVPNEQNISAYYKSEDYISHTNTSTGFINRLYQSVRKRTLKQKRKLVTASTGIRTGKLLDLGCGTGAFVNEMKQSGWEVTGLEPDADARAVAQRLYNIPVGDSSQFFALPTGTFDAIAMWHVLEHVHDLHGYVDQLKKLLSTEGKLFVAVPNYTSRDAAIYQQYWAAYDVPRHLYHFSPMAMQQLMERHGLKIVAHKPMWYDSFYVCMLSSKYKNGKTNLFSAVLNGLRSNFKAWGDVRKCSSVIYVISK